MLNPQNREATTLHRNFKGQTQITVGENLGKLFLNLLRWPEPETPRDPSPSNPQLFDSRRLPQYGDEEYEPPDSPQEGR